MGHSDLKEMGAEAKFRGELGGAAAMACSGAPEHRGELDSARGWGGSGEGGRKCALRELKGKEKGEGAGEMEKGRTAQRVVAVALRAAVLGVRAGKRCRVARSRSVGEEPGMGRRVWPGSSARGRRHRRRHGASTA